jgi:predicted HicB family RNase H-like nuclease
MSTVSFKKKGNKQIALRVEPELEEAMQRALKEDGDATLSAWIKRVIRKELLEKGHEIKKQ